MARIKIVSFIACSLLFLTIVSSCAPRSDSLESRIARDTASLRFGLTSWEVKSLAGELRQMLCQPSTDSESAEESLLEKRISEAFAQEEIFNPITGARVGFPPVTVSLGAPPYLLVVSPRDRIAEIRSVTLLPGISEKQMEDIERDIDSLGYSALVVELGGMATFPSYVSDNSGARFIIETTAHEWVHQYLTFTPLGFLYLLDSAGIRHDADVQTMNETVADIVGREIGDKVYEKYYGPLELEKEAVESAPRTFNIGAALRETRKTVEAYLAAGKIDSAESYMERQRLNINAHGYDIRKLNQAYFAFYGSYADSPASVSPIGADIKSLRAQSPSLKEFLVRVQGMTTARRLAASVQEKIAK